MSATDTKDRSDDLLRYAPQGVRRPNDDGTIRPVLERLSRGTSDGDNGARFAPPQIDGITQGERRGVRWPLIVAGTAAVAASAGLAFAAFAWMAPVQHEASQPQTADLKPKQVQTVTFKQQDRLAEAAPTAAQPAAAAPDVPPDATPSSAPARDAATKPDGALLAAAPAAPAQPARTIAPKELIALWSGVPAAVAQSPAGDAVPVQPAAANADATPVRAPDAKPAHHRVAHARHRTHHGRRHVARKPHAPAAETAQPQTQEAAAQPAETPLQSAWQTLFGHPVAGSGPAANTQAAFQ